MDPITYYQENCREGVILEDPRQMSVMTHLQRVYVDLLAERQRKSGLFGKLRRKQLVHGAYIWGGVGCGKTFMMDCFYQALPFKEKMRMHFHPFMRFIHEQLKLYQGKKNPLDLIAAEIGKAHHVLCFDEFVVSDITDAMLLARLLDALFKQGVCLVSTSNVKPDDLYKNGLQRRSFFPAIALLKKYADVIHIQTDIDYRLRYLKDAGVFYYPNDDLAKRKMEKTFSVLSHEDNAINENEIIICDRPIKVVKEVEKCVWFDFDMICSAPRSQHDYLELVKKYPTIFISDINQITPNSKDKIMLFIRLIDVLYDAKTKLVFSSSVPIEKIYPEGQFIFEFARTRSRLIEMQSEAYFY